MQCHFSPAFLLYYPACVRGRRRADQHAMAIRVRYGTKNGIEYNAVISNQIDKG